MQNVGFGCAWAGLECGRVPGRAESTVTGLRLWGGTAEKLRSSSSITSWFSLMKTFRQSTNTFQGTRSGVFLVFVLFCVWVCARAQWKSHESPSEVFVPPVPLSVISPRLTFSGSLSRLFWKTKSMSLKILVRLKEKLCEFCIITKKEKVGHIWSLLCLWKKKKREWRRKCQII